MATIAASEDVAFTVICPVVPPLEPPPELPPPELLLELLPEPPELPPLELELLPLELPPEPLLEVVPELPELLPPELLPLLELPPELLLEVVPPELPPPELPPLELPPELLLEVVPELPELLPPLELPPELLLELLPEPPELPPLEPELLLLELPDVVPELPELLPPEPELVAPPFVLDVPESLLEGSLELQPDRPINPATAIAIIKLGFTTNSLIIGIAGLSSMRIPAFSENAHRGLTIRIRLVGGLSIATRLRTATEPMQRIANDPARSGRRRVFFVIRVTQRMASFANHYLEWPGRTAASDSLVSVLGKWTIPPPQPLFD